EGGVAATALLVPVLLQTASWLYVEMAGGQPRPPENGDPRQTVFYLAATMAIVGLPTALMGATLPLIISYLVRIQHQIGSRVGVIYGINTAGAVLGVVIGAFYLMPAHGVSGVVWVAVCVNVLLLLVALALPEGHYER